MDINITPSWQPHEDVALALSGGIDSMVLYHLLTTRYKDTYKSLIVIHINHNVRAASAEEAANVEQMTSRDGVHLETTAFNFKDDFSQAKARVKRYAFFEDVMRRLNISWLLTGHHQDDQYETVLQQLLTGRHLYGNLGIPEVKQKGEYTVVRPLSSVTKADIKNYQAHYQITYFEDASNAGDDYTRNYVRHHIVPAIKASSTLDIKQLDTLRQDMNDLSDFAYTYAETFVQNARGRLSRQLYKENNETIRRYILTILLAEGNVRLGRHALSSLDEILLSSLAQHVFQADDVAIHIEYDTFYLSSAPKTVPDDCLSIEDNGDFIYNDYHVTVKLPQAELPLLLRQKQDGDRVYLKNTGTKKISRLFIDKKIPASERQKMPVAVNSQGIIIAVGTIYNIIKPSENRLLKITKEFNDDDSE